MGAVATGADEMRNRLCQLPPSKKLPPFAGIIAGRQRQRAAAEGGVMFKPGDRVRYAPPPSQGFPQTATVLRIARDRAVVRIDDPPAGDDGVRKVYADRLERAC
jgi:hypothetical protein